MSTWWTPQMAQYRRNMRGLQEADYQRERAGLAKAAMEALAKEMTKHPCVPAGCSCPVGHDSKHCHDCPYWAGNDNEPFDARDRWIAWAYATAAKTE